MKIEIDNNNYPQQLKNIKKPPRTLYCKGNIDLLNENGIAIIGTRNNTKYGEKMAKRFAKELSSYGLTIISGMAKGIDSFAHIGSIEGTGKTIAVLPSGLNKIYPEENIKLYNQILESGGLVISEYEENEKADSKKFLERNRIVSGLSIGVLVIEGGHRSGTSVTARLAKEQEKKVFCVPSSLENPYGITPNRLIKEGAFLVTEVEDIIRQYPELNLKKIKMQINKKQYNLSKISEEYRAIYNLLDIEKTMHINEIVRHLDMDIKEVSYKLMMLELEGKVVSMPGNIYKKI